jgi:membrane peptidoglycan carboxypeptidase
MMRHLLLLLLVLLTLGLCGCQERSPASSSEIGDARTEATAQRWQDQGVLSKQDYSHALNILASIRQTGKVSDSDLDWLLSVLRQSTSDPRAVHLLVMADLLNLRSISDTQSQKVRTAIDPFQQSDDSTERDLSILVLKNLQDCVQGASYLWLLIIPIVGGLAFLARKRITLKNM